jgi:hypothetical protein
MCIHNWILLFYYTFSHWNKIQVPVHFLQFLTEFLSIEFFHEEISPRVLALPLKGISPTTLGVKITNCQFKNGIVINMTGRNKTPNYKEWSDMS